MKQLFIIMLFLYQAVFMLRADEQEKHEFTAGFSPGLSTLTSLKHLSPCAGISLGYNYFFNDIAGLTAGAEWSFYKWKSAEKLISDTYPASGAEFSAFRYSVYDYAESQTASYLTVPLAFRMQYPLFYDEILTYFAVGGKIGFPLKAKYKTSGSTFEIQRDESQEFQEFYTTGRQTSTLRLKTAFILFAEAGLKFDIADQFSLYAGLYLDYGLNGITRESGKRFMEYNAENPANSVFNSMLNSQYTQDGNTRKFINRTNSVTGGLVIRFAFKLPD